MRLGSGERGLDGSRGDADGAAPCRGGDSGQDGSGQDGSGGSDMAGAARLHGELTALRPEGESSADWLTKRPLTHRTRLSACMWRDSWRYCEAGDAALLVSQSMARQLGISQSVAWQVALRGRNGKVSWERGAG